VLPELDPLLEELLLEEPLLEELPLEELLLEEPLPEEPPLEEPLLEELPLEGPPPEEPPLEEPPPEASGAPPAPGELVPQARTREAATSAKPRRKTDRAFMPRGPSNPDALFTYAGKCLDDLRQNAVLVGHCCRTLPRAASDRPSSAAAE
jgi:hypothetical protein